MRKLFNNLANALAIGLFGLTALIAYRAYGDSLQFVYAIMLEGFMLFVPYDLLKRVLLRKMK